LSPALKVYSTTLRVVCGGSLRFSLFVEGYLKVFLFDEGYLRVSLFVWKMFCGYLGFSSGLWFLLGGVLLRIDGFALVCINVWV